LLHFLWFDRAAGFLSPRPRILGAGERRGYQGRPSLRHRARTPPFPGRALIASSTAADWMITCGKSFTRTCRDLKIEDLHFQDLRHEGTSRLFEAGFSIQQVALVTGHKDWKMLRRYTHLKPETLHRISEPFDQQVNGPETPLPPHRCIGMT
jgi:integrase